IGPIFAVLELITGKNLATQENFDRIDEILTLVAVAAGVSRANAIPGAAEGGGESGFLAFTPDNFRENLARRTGTNPPGSQAHHIFAQWLREFFEKKGLNIDNPSFGTWWATKAHQKFRYDWNNSWKEFLKEYRSLDEIIDHGRRLAVDYGLHVYF